MPRSVAMSAVLRQLLRAARQADVRLDSRHAAGCDRADRLLDGADGRRRHRALLRRPAVPEAAAHAGRRLGLARARLRPALQRRLGQSGRRRGSAAAARGDDPPERLHVQRFGRRCDAHGHAARRPRLLRPRSRRLPQEGHPDERYRDTHGRPPRGRPRRRGAAQEDRSSPSSRSCSWRCSPSSCRSS